MSTMVQMPVRVKPPPAETGDTISPGCASLEIATPLNGARMTVLSRLVRSSSVCRSATRTCSRAARNPRVERIDFRLRLVDLGLRRELILHQLQHAAERNARLGEAHFVLADGSPRRFGLRLGERQRRARRRVVEPREHLSFADRHAFLDVDLRSPCR